MLIIIGAILLVVAMAFLFLGRGIQGASLLLLSLVLMLASAIVVVPAGHVGVQVLFGEVRPGALREGLHIVNPLLSVSNFSVRRHALEFQSSSNSAPDQEDSAVAVSKQGTHMTVDAVFPYQLNPDTAWRVYQRYGGQSEYTTKLLRPAARAAMRDAIQAHGWLEASTSERDTIAAAMRTHFQEYVRLDLMELGFSADEAAKAFVFPPVQLRKILPAEQILVAVADKLAAEEELKKQITVTAIANEIAKRRTREGEGIANLFAHLPRGFNPKEIATILTAMADKQRADALEKAVNTGQAKVFVVNGQTPLAMNMPQ